MFDALHEQAMRIYDDGVRLLKDFSSTHAVNTPGSSVILLSPSGDQFWNELSSEGKQIQIQLLPRIDLFIELVDTLTLQLPGRTQKKLGTALKNLRNAVEQNGSTWWKTTDEAVDGYKKLINEVIATLKDYLGTPSKAVLAIPDTNAFLGNPDIENWHFEDITQFEIILTPTVSSELDEHKINHRNPDVREKASKLIQKIKEYRRRGSLHEGVPIVKNRITFRCIAREPNMSQTLSWFDPANADDRFLATTLEIIRSDIGALTFIVTSDINMQNKAEVAGIPYHEVPTSISNEGKK
jgi:hypothetical protein